MPVNTTTSVVCKGPSTIPPATAGIAPPAVAPTPVPLVVVPPAAAAQVAVVSACSVTHPAAWAAFNRQLSNPSKMRTGLSGEVATRDGKSGLFRLWLDNQKCLKSCEVIYHKRSMTRRTGSAVYGYRKKRQIRTMYEGRADLEEFIEKMVKKLKADGKFIKDEFAPTDEEEHGWYVRVDVTMTNESVLEEVQEFRAVADVSGDMQAALGGDDNPFVVENPDISMLLDEPADMGKNKQKNPPNTPKEVVEKTYNEKLDAFKVDLLAEAVEARKFRTTLQLFELSPDQVQKLSDHATSMEDPRNIETQKTNH